MSVSLSLFAGAGAQFLDNNGNLLSGGKIYTYQAGTTTPLTTYTSSTGNTPHTNPIVLDSAGRVPSGGEIWLTLGIGYKFIVRTSAEVLIATYDNIPSSAQPPASNDADSIMYEQGYTVTANSFVIGKMYRIASVGTTDFTLIGAVNNVVGTHFIATGVGSGTGTAELSRSVEAKLRETVSVKDFNAVGDGVTDDTAAFTNGLTQLRASGGVLTVPAGTYVITQSLAIPSNVTLQGQGVGSVILLNNCSITPALIVGNTYTAATPPSAYYTRGPSTNTGNFVATVTVSAPAGSTQLTLSNGAGLSTGDYLFLSNGYCDMYRVMEQYTGPYTDWQQIDVKLWQAEFVQVASVVGNIVTLEIPTTIGITVPTTTYGLFPDENNLPQYAGFNTPSVEKLCGAVNASVRDLQINANIGVSQAAILSYLSQNFVVENVNITSTGRGIQNFSALSPVIKSCFIDSQSFAISVRRASFNAIVDVCDTIYSGLEDGSVLVWERTNNSTISNINVASTNGISSAAAIGVYLNTCSNNTVTNVTGKWLKTSVSIGFSDGCVVSNVVGQSTDALVTAFSSRDFVVSGGVMTGKYTASPTAFTAVLFFCSQSYNATYSDLKHSASYTATPYGRIHLFEAFNVHLSNIVSPLAQLWLSTEDAKTLYPSLPRAVVDNCEFAAGTLSSTTYNDTTQRISYFSNTKFFGQVYVERTLYTSFDNCTFTGSNGVSLHNSAYTSIQNSSFDCSYAVEFKGLVSSNQIVSSFIRFTNNQITSATAKFNNYVNVNGYFVPPGGPPELTSRQTEIVTILDQYPLIKEWANTGSAGSSASSWKQYFKSPDYV